MAAKANKTSAVKKAPASKAKAKGAKAAVKKRSGPRLTPAQWKAYRAAAQKVTRQQQSEALRLRRLKSAARVTQKQAAALYQRRRAKVAQQAVRRTFAQVAGGHQVAANRARAARNVFRATQLATQAQFIHQGISIHAHQVRMQTITRRQAASAQARFAVAARRRAQANLKPKSAKKILKKAAASPRQAVKKPVARGYSAQAKSAGLRAAAALGPVNSPRRAVKRPKAKRATRQVQTRKTQASVARNKAKSAVSAAQSSKAKAHTSSTGHAAPKKAAAPSLVTASIVTGWVTAGNDEGRPNCVAVALANHLLAWHDYRLSYEAIESLNWLGHEWGLTIPEALEHSKHGATWPWRVNEYCRIDKAVPGSLVRLDTVTGSHAAVLMPGNRMVSWGKLVPVPDTVDEYWYASWKKD
jgi:hypothetical protein